MDRNELNLVVRLAEFAARVATVVTIDELADALLEIVGDVVEVKYSGFYFFDPTTEALRLLAARGSTEEERLEAERTAKERHPIQVLRSGRMLHVPDTEEGGTGSVNSPRSFSVRARLYIPVKSERQVVGALGLGSTRPRAFQTSHIEMLSFAASVAGAVYGRLRAHEETRRREARLELVLLGADLGMWDWHIPSGEVTFNERWASMLGYRLDEIEPNLRAWDRLLHPEDRLRILSVLDDHLAGRTEFYRTEHRLRTKAGEWIWVLDAGRVYQRDGNGRPVRAAGIHLDVTSHHKARQALEEYGDQLEKVVAERTAELRRTVDRLSLENLNRRTAEERHRRARRKLQQTTEALVLAEEAERRRIAVRVHDDLGQELTLARIQLRRASDVARTKVARDAIGLVDKRLAEIVRRTRTITADMSPAVLYQFGLQAALEDLVEEVDQQHELKARFDGDGSRTSLGQRGQILLYQIVKELIHNAVKHSHARELLVTYREDERRAVLSVEDDGIGLPEDLEMGPFTRRRNSGIGIFSCRERMLNVGGNMHFAPREEGGTQIVLVFPLADRRGNDEDEESDD